MARNKVDMYYKKINLLDVAEVAKQFASEFFKHRSINLKFYELVPEDKYDYRMVDTITLKSDSVLDSITHQIEVQQAYLLACEKGKLEFGAGKLHDSLKLKVELIGKLISLDKSMLKLLSSRQAVETPIIVPWKEEPVTVIQMLWGLNSHEILHTGWNLAVMDHLGIERFDELKQIWG
jgi:uncharacterized damage-inducible protein DinB